MSRIGKLPITIPPGVAINIEKNQVTVKGPKGSVSNHLPAGVTLGTEDGSLVVKREDDSKAAVHGLVRALVNNAVVGVTSGWTRELEIVGIGYRAELSGKARASRGAVVRAAALDPRAVLYLDAQQISFEHQTGTLTLLFTSPIRDYEIVLGKFFSALIFFCVMTLLTIYMPLLIFVNGKVSLGHIFGAPWQIAHAQHVRGIDQPLGMFFQPKDRWALVRVVAANAFKKAGSIADHV